MTSSKNCEDIPHHSHFKKLSKGISAQFIAFPRSKAKSSTSEDKRLKSTITHRKDTNSGFSTMNKKRRDDLTAQNLKSVFNRPNTRSQTKELDNLKGYKGLSLFFIMPNNFQLL